MKRNNGYNDYNNGLDMEGLGDKRAGDRKGEEHGYEYYQGHPPPPASRRYRR